MSASPSEAPEVTTGKATGTVLDAACDPLAGATIRVEGTSLAAAADLDGNFSIANVKIGAKLIVSYVGYNPTTVTWEGQYLTIHMDDDSSMLDEVVVVGYGVQKKVNVTGAISQVKGDELSHR